VTAENHYFQTRIDISGPDQIRTIDEMPQGSGKG
jgi:hypothetical protein